MKELPQVACLEYKVYGLQESQKPRQILLQSNIEGDLLFGKFGEKPAFSSERPLFWVPHYTIATYFFTVKVRLCSDLFFTNKV